MVGSGPMRPSDLTLLRIPSMPALSPDGRLAAVALTRIDLEADTYRSEIWVMPTDGSIPPRRFTSGFRDHWPRFSPDGRLLAGAPARRPAAGAGLRRGRRRDRRRGRRRRLRWRGRGPARRRRADHLGLRLAARALHLAAADGPGRHHHARRLPGERLGGQTGRQGPVPGAAHDPRRALHPVWLPAARRGPGLRRRRLRGSDGQPARLLRLRRGARPGDRLRQGNLDSTDLLALLDAALTDPELDGDRAGVLGGFMTSWLVGHTDRFRAAISERAVNAFDSFEGSSDIGAMFLEVYVGTDPERVKAQSPLTYADKIQTPMLLIHSEEDWRCPLEQAQRLFVALKRRRAEAEMLVFPAEGHELSRSGLPSHRAARFDAILDWWDRHLTGAT